MPTEIKCPNCGHLFPMEEAVSEEYKQELREQMLAFKKEKEKELQKKQEEFARKEQDWVQQAQKQEGEFARRLGEEKTRLQQTLEESLRRSIGSDFENKLRLLEDAHKDSE